MRQQRNQQRLRVLLIAVAALVVVALIVVAVIGITNGFSNGGEGGKTTTTTGPRDPQVIATATVGNSGDVLIHNTVRASVYDAASGKFDFTDSFAFLKPYVDEVDYAVVNAEFSVSTNNSYSALPFRVPVSVVEALKNCGYDMGLTANNHIGDGGVAGIKKTMETLAEYGMDYTGSRLSTDDKRYVVKNINGINIGFLNYTYGGAWNTNGFSNSNLNALYTDAEKLIAAMRADGADLIYLYIHWGEEYALTPNNTQQEIAQKMCDMGVDAIIGGHPHKIQPLELVKSTDGTRQMICLYSSGNLLSGQQIECMAGGTQANSPHCFQDSWHHPGCDYPDVADRTKDTHRLEHGPTCNDNGHTEDGLLFNITASKYEDGTVMITGVDILPVWCMGRGFKRAGYPTNSSFEDYILIPLEQKDVGAKYSLSDAEAVEAGYSYDRTMALVGDGITEINALCKERVDAFVKEFHAAQTTTAPTAQ